MPCGMRMVRRESESSKPEWRDQAHRPKPANDSAASGASGSRADVSGDAGGTDSSPITMLQRRSGDCERQRLKSLERRCAEGRARVAAKIVLNLLIKAGGRANRSEKSFSEIADRPYRAG